MSLSRRRPYGVRWLATACSPAPPVLLPPKRRRVSNASKTNTRRYVGRGARRIYRHGTIFLGVDVWPRSSRIAVVDQSGVATWRRSGYPLRERQLFCQPIRPTVNDDAKLLWRGAKHRLRWYSALQFSHRNPIHQELCVTEFL